GAAITQMMLNQVEAWVQTPGAPNLYWSLTALPRPFLDVYPAAAEDLAMLERMMPWLAQGEGGPMTAKQEAAARRHLEKQFQEFGMRPQSDDERAAREAMIEAVAREAREVLKKQGSPDAQLDAMPAFQLASLYSWRECRTAGAELIKWLHVPGG